MIQAFAQAVVEQLRKDLTQELSKPTRDIAMHDPGQTDLPQIAVVAEDINFAQGQQRVPLMPTADGAAVQRDFTAALSVSVSAADSSATERLASLALASIALAPELIGNANKNAAATQQTTGIRATQAFRSYRILEGLREDTEDNPVRSYSIEVVGNVVFERVGLDLGKVIKEVKVQHDSEPSAPQKSAVPETPPEPAPPAPLPESSAPAWIAAVNAATLDELDAVRGIGKATAQKIMTARPYADEDQLKAANGITTSRFNALKKHFDV